MKFYKPFKVAVKSKSSLDSVFKNAKNCVAVIPKSAEVNTLPEWYKKAMENDCFVEEMKEGTGKKELTFSLGIRRRK
jgi:hypothetical protein